MKKIVKTRSKILGLCLACFFMIFAVVIAFNVNTTDLALAETSVKNEGTNAVKDDTASPQGSYVHLTLTINGGNGRMVATVKNDLTVFPATVFVIVELYSSDTYQDSYTTMTRMMTTSIADLNMGKTITAECSTGGVQKFWQARMKYRVNNGPWKSEETRTILCDADGGYIA